MAVDLSRLSLTEIIQLQNAASLELRRRFEKRLALAFTDVVGSTAYFEHFGNEAGRRLLQRHLDRLEKSVPQTGGRIVDTAGDGAFTCFPHVDSAVTAMIELQASIARENALESRDHQLAVRCGIHCGSVLTDNILVTGDAVNLASRVCSLGHPGELLLTLAAFQELPPAVRSRCKSRPPVAVKGVLDPVQVLALEWRDRARFPARVRIEETREELGLPELDVITFGRMRRQADSTGNDVVLRLSDEALTRKISRWHFELRRHPDGFRLRAITDRGTAVDGVPVRSGVEVAVRSGSVVRVSDVLTVVFLPDSGLPLPASDDSLHIVTLNPQ